MMNSFLQDYINFVFYRPLLPQRDISLIAGYYPNAWTHFFVLLVCFMTASIFIPHFLNLFFHQWWSSLTFKKQQEYPSYILSLLHHLVAVPCGWILVYGDYNGLLTNQRSYEGTIYSLCEQIILPWCTAYMTSDMLTFCIPQVLLLYQQQPQQPQITAQQEDKERGHEQEHGQGQGKGKSQGKGKGRAPGQRGGGGGEWEYLIHHIAVLWMSYAMLSNEQINFLPHFAHMVISETTGIFFSSAWLLRSMGYRDTMIVTTFERMFAITFFVLRGIHLTVIFLHLFFIEESKSMGIVRFAFPIIALLQWFWLMKIIRSVFITGRGGNKVIAKGPASSGIECKTTEKDQTKSG